MVCVAGAQSLLSLPSPLVYNQAFAGHLGPETGAPVAQPSVTVSKLTGGFVSRLRLG